MNYQSKQNELLALRTEMKNYIISVMEKLIEKKINPKNKLSFIIENSENKIIIKNDIDHPHIIIYYYVRIKSVIIKHYKIPCYKDINDCELEILNDICETISMNLK